MITIHEIGLDGAWTGRTAQIDAVAGAPLGWTRTAPPTLTPETQAVWTGEAWAAAPSQSGNELGRLKAERLAMVRALRQRVESAGVAVGEIQVRTDATSQAKITGILQLMASAPDLASIDFEVQPGQWVTLDRATMTAIGVAVGRHVQTCFSRARELQAEIEAAPDLATLEAIVLVSGWPGQGAIALA